MSDIEKKAQEMKTIAGFASEKIETTLTIMEEINEINQQMDNGISELKILFEKETRKATYYLYILVFLLVCLIFTWLHPISA